MSDVARNMKPSCYLGPLLRDRLGISSNRVVISCRSGCETTYSNYAHSDRANNENAYGSREWGRLACKVPNNCYGMVLTRWLVTLSIQSP
jgi:hypothetical protein